MPTIDLILPTPHPAQRRVIQEAQRFNVLCLGRRWGKTTLGSDRLIHPALSGDPVAWFSPTYKMLAEVWRDITRLLRPVIARTITQQNRIELITGGTIDMWSLDEPDAARGRKYRRIVIDEAAMIRYLQEAWDMVIRSTLIDLEGDAWFLSTPKGFGYFKTLFDIGQDPQRPEWQSWQMPSMANPHIPAAELEEARRTMPERAYMQEILAEFLPDGGGVFRNVAAAATAERSDPYDGQFVMGVDWGRENDFTVLTVFDVDSRRMVDFDRFTQIGWQVQRDRLRSMAARWNPMVILAERNSIGGPNIEALESEGLPVQSFTTTNATKARIVESLALAFETGTITILDIPELVAELQAFEMERLPSGLIRYTAPGSQHDDCVISLALALAASEVQQPDIDWISI